jgi:hypothetical protein
LPAWRAPVAGAALCWGQAHRAPVFNAMEVRMYQVILLTSETTFARERWDAVEEVLDYAGATYSLRAGPRQPLPTDHAWDPVAVYAPDEISEEEFQDWYARLQPQVEELRLKY